jgi:hypothetical protein
LPCDALALSSLSERQLEQCLAIAVGDPDRPIRPIAPPGRHAHQIPREADRLGSRGRDMSKSSRSTSSNVRPFAMLK